MLAAAHKNNDVWNSTPDFIALCQRRHLSYDARLHAARSAALRLQRKGRTAIHVPIALAKICREGDVRHHVGAARKYAEIAQIIAQGIEVGEEFSVILEINLALVGQALYVKTEEGIFLNSETGTAEMLHLALGVPFETALEVNSKE